MPADCVRGEFEIGPKAYQSRWIGSGVVVEGKAGGSGQAPFSKGVAVYQGANTGLMAGANVGLEVLRYEPLGN
jgi:hypothetical protein